MATKTFEVAVLMPEELPGEVTAVAEASKYLTENDSTGCFNSGTVFAVETDEPGDSEDNYNVTLQFTCSTGVEGMLHRFEDRMSGFNRVESMEVLQSSEG